MIPTNRPSAGSFVTSPRELLQRFPVDDEGIRVREAGDRFYSDFAWDVADFEILIADQFEHPFVSKYYLRKFFFNERKDKIFFK